ncbi:hypothetical protein [Phyllobacterium sp. P5_D12]
MPKPEFGMDQYSEWRRAQAFRLLCPLLEWQIGPIGGKHGYCTEFHCNGTQNILGPLIERILGIRVVLPPPREMRPNGRPEVANQDNTSKMAPLNQGRRSVLFVENETAARDQTIWLQRGGDLIGDQVFTIILHLNPLQQRPRLPGGSDRPL